MKTFVCQEFGPPQTLAEIDVPVPSPGDEELLIDISAVGIGFVDGLMIQGKYQVKPNLPYYPGSEFAGVVSQVGEKVDNFAPGDRVFGLSSGGALADFALASRHSCHKIPDALPTAVAAGWYINYLTALYGLRSCGDLQPGETVLILGAAGGVGSSAISVANALGARVIAAASTEDKRKAAMANGADATVDYSNPDWRSELKSLTTTSGLQMVYDPVGGDASELAFRSLSPDGRLLVVGFASGTIPAIPLNLPLLKRSAIIGVDWGGESRANPEINTPLMDTLLDWVSSKRLIPANVVQRPFNECRSALEDQLAGKINGKLVLTK